MNTGGTVGGTTSGPEAVPTQYTISPVPLDDPEQRYAYPFNVTVEWRGDGLWAVVNGDYTLTSLGDWEYEPRPSSRDDGYLARCRFDLDTALLLARDVASAVEVNGMTWEQYLAWRSARRALDDAP